MRRRTGSQAASPCGKIGIEGIAGLVGALRLPQGTGPEQMQHGITGGQRSARQDEVQLFQGALGIAQLQPGHGKTAPGPEVGGIQGEQGQGQLAGTLELPHAQKKMAQGCILC